MDGWAAVVLAAGMGTRMRSDRVKVLHSLCGRPMVAHVIAAAREAGAARVIVVVGPQAAEIQAALGTGVEYAHQPEPRGTGDALLRAEPLLREHSGPLLVTYGDTPLWRAESFRRLVAAHAAGPVASLLTVELPDPTGYGRIVRRHPGGPVLRIVEHRDASPAERQIREINTGTYCFEPRALFAALRQIRPDNEQRELYLTDVIGVLVDAGERVEAVVVEDPSEALGVNDRVQLAEAARIIRRRLLERVMLSGVTVVDPATTYIDVDVVIGRETVIHPFTILAGRTRIGERCTIGPGCRLRDTVIEDGTTIEGVVADGGRIAAGARVGPFTLLRSGSEIGSEG